MKAFLDSLNVAYLTSFIILGILYCFLFLKGPFWALPWIVVPLIFGMFIFIVVSQITAWMLRKITDKTSQDPDLNYSLLAANLLFILLLFILITTFLKRHPTGQNSLILLAMISVPFFASIFGGILSGSLVLLNRWDSSVVYRVGQLTSLLVVVLFFAFQFLTTRF